MHVLNQPLKKSGGEDAHDINTTETSTCVTTITSENSSQIITYCWKIGRYQILRKGKREIITPRLYAPWYSKIWQRMQLVLHAWNTVHVKKRSHGQRGPQNTWHVHETENNKGYQSRQLPRATHSPSMPKLQLRSQLKELTVFFYLVRTQKTESISDFQVIKEQWGNGTIIQAE